MSRTDIGTVPPPGAHGGDGEAIARALGRSPDNMLDLSASLNPFAPNPAPIVARHLYAGALARYPDPAKARDALAEAIGVDRDLLVLTNGGAEAISLVAANYPVGWVEEPDFSLYRRHLSHIDPAGLVWRSDPHSPTGLLAGPDETADIWDEAFYPLASGSWTAPHRPQPQRSDLGGCIVLGSLTKLLACPGLRIGYVLAPDPGVAQRLLGSQPEWSVNGLVCAALPDLLETVDLQRWSALLAEARSELEVVLRRHGLVSRPSQASWLLVDAPTGLRDSLAIEGVVVRSCASFGMPATVRIAVPGPEGLKKLDRALDRLDCQTGGPVAQAPPLRLEPAAASIGGAILICGTGSDAGKSAVVAGLCRALARRGYKVAPFKAQNMALNSAVTADGAEIGRAQAAQSMAAGIEPTVDMNPILLKPTGERTSQVVVMGRPWKTMDAAAYQAAKPTLQPTVLEALNRLRSSYDIVICEGAGSPTEINLLQHDLVNMGLAEAAGLAVVVVGDIDRGGVFASLFGTVALLPEHLRSLIKGFVINKFRGDPEILRPGLVELEARSGVPVLGVVPWLAGLQVDAEDSLALDDPTFLSGAKTVGDTTPDVLDIAVIRLPRISNFTDFEPLALEPSVSLRLVSRVQDLGSPDLVVIPGSKETVSDLAWMRGSGIAAALQGLIGSPSGPAILGICGGYQMLGDLIVDDAETKSGRVAGLGLLPVDTEFGAEKTTRHRNGRTKHASNLVVSGYEIHHGQVSANGSAHGRAEPWFELEPVTSTAGSATDRWAGSSSKTPSSHARGTQRRGIRNPAGKSPANRTRRQILSASVLGSKESVPGSKESVLGSKESVLGSKESAQHFEPAEPLEEEGMVDSAKGVFGTTLHGILEDDAFRRAFLQDVAGRRGRKLVPTQVSFAAARAARFDALADALEEIDLVDRILDLATPSCLPDAENRRLGRRPLSDHYAEVSVEPA